ncbi:MAG: nucleoside-diphosphate sugar epimerase/dehydratase [Gemmiger sp.]|uniref:polysaccharide biosynthesis protein n=1 Tax=Gemmiger sp. TaxID=2049027 RepID=UPI002E774029|nr:nucleoside-diphosphate sugar epimerase/dehydratase [Gemmiger sp.]MEE0801571.1 nucleoside-diphosphate sugar epimerase/dehydratase [Gemmiger sp.]
MSWSIGFKNKRKQLLMLTDLVLYAAVYLFGYLIMGLSSASCDLPPARYLLNALVFAAFIFGMRFAMRVYTNVWRYADSKSYLQLVCADLAGGLTATALTYGVRYIYMGIWQSASLVAMVNVITLTSRFVYQRYYRHCNVDGTEMNKIGVAIVGAGQVGALLAEELTCSSASHYRPVCYIDKDRAKIGGRVAGLRVYGEDESIIERLKAMPVQEIFIALPSIDGDAARHLYDFYSRTGCKIKLYDFPFTDAGTELNAERRVIREIKIEDLLFRDSMKIDDAASRAFYAGKVVLITGGGGSIGSELCRQVARCAPRQIVIFDIYENNAYAIQQELIRRYGTSLDLAVEIGSVRDRARLESVFAHYRPQVVFHAAAHKHVPLMEHSGCDAVKNNVFGTYNTADMAEKYGVGKFILISTDKSVNPTNIMGATKRLCEMVIQCRTDSKTSFAAVRFGNVLGSNGSVIPLFQKQIEKGGPLTITDKRIIRYFMTIPEASQLVMLAGAMARRGELFVLNMGKPVRILDLAENMIRLSGLVPYRDIDIREIGLRPGEKLYEEPLMKNENLESTDNDRIFIEHDTPLPRSEVDRRLEELRGVLRHAETSIGSEEIREAMKRAVPTFRDPEEVNEHLDRAALAGMAL